jgi:molybdate transport system substrate-binding protein
MLSSGARVEAVVLTKESINELINNGVLVSPCLDFASTCIGVAMRQGLSRPDISTVEKLKRFLIEAPSLSYTSNGVSGVYTAQLIERLGLTQTLASKTKMVSGGYAAQLIASGEVQYSIQNMSELMPIAGIEIVGPLPSEVQLISTFSGALTNALTSSGDASTGAAEFFKLLKSELAHQIFASKGMTPV